MKQAVIHLLRQLSNPPQGLTALLEDAVERAQTQKVPRPWSIPDRKRDGTRKYGSVKQAVMQVLAEADEPLTVKQIRERAEASLGGPVRLSSVKDSLKE